MSNKYLVKLAGMTDLLGKAKGLASSVTTTIGRHSRSLMDDAKTMANPVDRFGRKNKSRLAIVKSIARNPVAQAGTGAVAMGGSAAVLRSKKADDQ